MGKKLALVVIVNEFLMAAACAEINAMAGYDRDDCCISHLFCQLLS
jgi:hypothetical protein